jgi:hypothetical protein
MLRTIPGTQEVEGREFLYIESSAEETFHQLVNAVLTVCAKLALPSSGGTIEEKVRLKPMNGPSLMGVSYKGDVDGWRTRFVEFCITTGRCYGSIREGRLFLSDGRSPLLEELEVDFSV